MRLLADLFERVLFLAALAVHTLLRPIWLRLPPIAQLFLYLSPKRFLLRHALINDPVLLPDSAVTERDAPADQRTWEGSLNDLKDDKQAMGMAGCPFAYNTRKRRPQPDECPAHNQGPNPVEVADRVMSRNGQAPKTRALVNLLGGAWIQFQTHDWFQLKKDENGKPVVQWPVPGQGDPATLKPLVTDPATKEYVNGTDHWWSMSALYGSTKADGQALREPKGGKMRLVPNEQSGTYLPVKEGLEEVGFRFNLWSGLTMLHYVFAREHNVVCDMLRDRYPAMSDDEVYEKARLIIAAMQAKIHTVEWTTAIIQNPTGRAVQYTLWYGLLGSLLGRKLLALRRATRWAASVGLEWLFSLLLGIPGGPTVWGGPGGGKDFAHTHEFVAVYRLHSLLPDEVSVRSAATGQVAKVAKLEDLLFEKGAAVNQATKAEDVLFSLGTGHAGSLELGNYPTALRSLRTNTKQLVDLAAADVYRTREVGLPLFNDFRKALFLARKRGMDGLGHGNLTVLKGLEEVYGGDVDKVDLIVGLLGEEALPGFIFGESTYSVFVLQTQRRLESDRFFTESYCEEVYTPEGIRHVEETTMSSLLIRHFPVLSRHLHPDDNAFIPWERSTKRRIHEKVAWDVFFPGQIMRWLSSA